MMHTEIYGGRGQAQHQRLNAYALPRSYRTSYANHHAGFYISNTRHTQRKHHNAPQQLSGHFQEGDQM